MSDLDKACVREVVEHRQEASVRQAIAALPEALRQSIKAMKFPRIRGQGGRSTFRKDCQHATNTSHL